METSIEADFEYFIYEISFQYLALEGRKVSKFLASDKMYQERTKTPSSEDGGFACEQLYQEYQQFPPPLAINSTQTLNFAQPCHFLWLKYKIFSYFHALKYFLGKSN